MDEELLQKAKDRYERYQRYRAGLAQAERDLDEAVDEMLAAGASEEEVRQAITGYGDVKPRLSRAPRPAAPPRPPASPPRRPPPPTFKAGEEGWWGDSAP